MICTVTDNLHRDLSDVDGLDRALFAILLKRERVPGESNKVLKKRVQQLQGFARVAGRIPSRGTGCDPTRPDPTRPDP